MGCLLHQSPKFYYNVLLFVVLTNLKILKWLRVQTFQLLIVIYRRSNLVYYYWGCTSIYRPLSYPFRSFSSSGDILLYFCLNIFVSCFDRAKMFLLTKGFIEFVVNLFLFLFFIVSVFGLVFFLNICNSKRIRTFMKAKLHFTFRKEDNQTITLVEC